MGVKAEGGVEDVENVLLKSVSPCKPAFQEPHVHQGSQAQSQFKMSTLQSLFLCVAHFFLRTFDLHVYILK